MADTQGGIFGPASQPQVTPPGNGMMAGQGQGLPQAGVTPTPGLTLQQLLPLIQALIARAQAGPQMQMAPGVQNPINNMQAPQGMTGNAMPQPSGPYTAQPSGVYTPISNLGIRG